MNDLYRKTFDEIHASAALRQEVLNVTKQEKTAAKRQIPRMLLIAAIVVLVLAGTALAAAAPGIRQWFSQQWTQQTGRPIHTDQLGLIDQLSDAVGVSAQSGGVTVTVDSVTRGENVIWFLLRYDGLPPEEELEQRFRALERPRPNGESTRKELTINGTEIIMGSAVDLWEEELNSPRNYRLKEMAISFAPAIADPDFYAWSLEQDGVRADGSMMALLEYTPKLLGEAALLDALDVTLELSEINWGTSSVMQVPVAEGPWTLTFSLPAIEPPEPLTTGGGTAWGTTPLDTGCWDSSTMGPRPAEEMPFRDIQVTPTGFTIFWADPEQTTRLYTSGFWYLRMTDGTELRADPDGWVYSDLPGSQRVSRFIWPVPVDLRQASSLEYRHREDDVQSFALK